MRQYRVHVDLCQPVRATITPVDTIFLPQQFSGSGVRVHWRVLGFGVVVKPLRGERSAQQHSVGTEECYRPSPRAANQNH